MLLPLRAFGFPPLPFGFKRTSLQHLVPSFVWLILHPESTEWSFGVWHLLSTFLHHILNALKFR